MGKKSKNKKEKKALENKSKKIKSNSKLKPFRKLIALFIILFILLFASIAAMIFFLGNTFKSNDFAHYLPYEKTVFFAEINTDLNHLQNIKTFELIEREKGLSIASIIEKIENKYGFSFENEVKNWLNRKIGLALIKINEHTESLIYFAEVYNTENADNFFNIKAPLEEYKNFEIYNSNNRIFMNEVFLVKLDSYYVISEDISALKFLIETYHESFKLGDSEKYKRISSNLPFQKVAFAFIDYTKINAVNIATISENMPYITNETLINLLDQNHSEGIAVIAQDDKFFIKTFVNYLNSNTSLELPEKSYNAALLNIVPNDTLLFFAGAYLDKNVDNFKLRILDKLYSNLFTSKINIDSDILPLFENEYLILLNNNSENTDLVFSFILDIKGEETEKINEIIENFIEKNAGFTEKKVLRELEDGSSYYEIIAVNKDIPKTQFLFENTEITAFEIEEKNISLFYTIKEDVLYLSFDLKVLEKILSTKVSNSILELENFKNYVSEIQSFSDEITYINFTKLENTESFKDFKTIFQYFDIYVHGQSYYKDGLSTINLLKIK